jgi:hypothetical protein
VQQLPNINQQQIHAPTDLRCCTRLLWTRFSSWPLMGQQDRFLQLTSVLSLYSCIAASTLPCGSSRWMSCHKWA